MDFLKKEMKLERKHVILFVIFNFLILGIYYTYSIFVVRQIKEDISLISVKSNVLTMASTNLTNNSIVVPADTTSNITINVSNSVSSKMYYRIIHEGVPTGVAVYETNSDGSSVGEIAGSGSVTSAITIENTTSNPVTIIFKCQESTKEEFDIEMYYSYVNIEKNFDHSGAYVLEDMDSAMIPVYYDETGSVWKKADYDNVDSDHIWYDYDNFRWANLVTVSETNRESYKEAEYGTTISNSDINAFFVYIPEYKYYIVSGDGNTSFEKVINVQFTNWDREYFDNYGTVECVEAISNEDDKHLYSEICTDETYGSVYNNLSTYLHPAFNKGNYVTGFYVGKFANTNSSTIYIKPNTQLSTSYNFTNSNIRKMMADGNIYGFENQVPDYNYGYNSSTWNYDAKRIWGTNTMPITSMQWGAIAILSSSQYGKSGNPMYQTDSLKSFTRIYNNTSSTYSGRSTNYTTSSTSISNSSTNTVNYDDLTDVTHTSGDITYPIGYKGAGASTTGTIYGVYDMAGGNETMVMGVIMNEDGTSDLTIDPIYYTAYSYIPYEGVVDDASKAAYLETFRLGDGVKEHVRSFTTNGMWQDGTLELARKGIMRRGGYTTNGSLYTTKIINDPYMVSTFTVVYRVLWID